MADLFAVENLRELQTLFAKAGPEANRHLRKKLREVAEPIRADAERFAATGIRRIGPNWSRMRVGVTRNFVYVAPRERGTRRRDPRSRPQFATLMEQRAMIPAREKNEALVEQRVEELFDDLAARWNRA